MPKVLSISVAAYNVEKFIKQALDSYIDERILDDIEVIVTDDGSKDSTPQIVAEYQEKYPGAIRLVSQKNAGPGSTVNSGIKHAAGKYFKMIDGDDWVNTGEMVSFVNALKNTDCDLIATNYCMVDDKTGEERPQHIDGVEYGREYRFEEVDPSQRLSMHNLTIKTSILKDNNIVIDNCFYTDAEYLMMPIPYAGGILFLDYMVYMYRVSLDTQSMNIFSLQKNVAMHEKVLFRLSGYYQDYKNSGNATAAKLNYLQNRIAEMAGNHLNIYLSFEDTAAKKAEFRAFLSKLKRTSDDIYKCFCRCKTMRVLNLSGFALYGTVSGMHRKKLKKQNIL